MTLQHPPLASTALSAAASSRDEKAPTPPAVRGVIDLGLARVHQLLCHAGHPERKINVVHVAGTNGKGSTCAFLVAGLREVHGKVGQFTSPHFVHPSDGWQCNGVSPSLDEYQLARDRVLAAYQGVTTASEDAPTEFELDFVACLTWFVAQGVDVAVIEVGVGGRLDATNVFRPGDLPCGCTERTSKLLATVVTKIGIDHVGLLGSTVAEIASHKAGIMKRGTPCFIGVQTEPDATAVLVDEARRVGCADQTLLVHDARVATTESRADLIVRTSPIDGQAATILSVPLPAKPAVDHVVTGYQVENAALAATVLRHLHPSLLLTSLGAALESMRWPARLDRTLSLPFDAAHPTPILLDGAHNLDGARALRAYLDVHFPSRLTWVLGMTAGKDVSGVLRTLVHDGDSVVCVGFNTPRGMPWIRCTGPHELADAVRAVVPGATVRGTADRVWRVTSENLGPLDVPVVVAGSLYLAADVYRWSRGQHGDM
ncbi:FolC protein [Allomyces macrogynus ATCC 38327]|uniref:FolC protein n=1 Tax=Allomyces macrogynus (strain ATCC 38327) TaxID=578462 RepID=A0A0L0SXA0_ALLM3|nr:FolC protein [Allomyces macrogynus ATCC 38327]|eukprot:KNE66954.1 FolC protein [Allomyces macrogynus ATCC 38327]